MTAYRARIMDSSTGGEGIYDFEDGEDLLGQTPVRVIRKFMEHAEHDLIPHQYGDYELNAAFKNDTAHVVTGLGSLLLANGATIPFMIMISARAAEPN